MGSRPNLLRVYHLLLPLHLTPTGPGVKTVMLEVNSGPEISSKESGERGGVRDSCEVVPDGSMCSVSPGLFVPLPASQLLVSPQCL